MRKPWLLPCAALVALPAFLLPSSQEAWRQGPPVEKERRWALWPALPIAPYERRLTKRYEVVPNELWTFEQKQGILYIHVPIRMTVYRMRSVKGLFVYAPVAPTQECLELLQELVELHGEVRHIVLPTVAVEHKYFVGPFSQNFPKAQVWVCPGQFSVPLQLPLQLLGFPNNVKTLDPQSLPEEWREEGLDFRVLGPVGKDLQNGPFAEVAFYLRRLRTMLVTDLVVSVPDEAPEIVAEEPRSLAFHARDDASKPVVLDDEALKVGWRRVALFALFFQSSAIEPEPVLKALQDAWKSEEKDLGWAGLLPWRFTDTWQRSFEALRGGLFVAPILSELILNRYLTTDVWPFVEDTASAWSDMERIIPAHFEAPVKASAKDWRDAFDRAFGEEFSFQSLFQAPGPKPLEADLQYLRNISKSLVEAGVTDVPERIR